MGVPSLQDFKSSMRLSLIEDIKVATEEANLAKKVHSPNAQSLKGKFMQPKPTPVPHCIMEILDELINITKESKSSADGLSVNGLNFLTTIADTLFCRFAALIKSTD